MKDRLYRLSVYLEGIDQAKRFTDAEWIGHDLHLDAESVKWYPRDVWIDQLKDLVIREVTLMIEEEKEACYAAKQKNTG